jgi:dihydrofolate reductase
MRRLVVTQNITLDGVVDADGGWFQRAGSEEVDQSDMLAALQEQTAASDGFLTGRLTFEAMRDFWPRQVDDATGVTAHLDRVAKYVVSSTMTDPLWENSTVLSGPLVEEIEAIKAQPGSDIVTTGSITLVHDLIRHGLVDEYRLFVFPVVLGKGRRLFEQSTGVPALRLLESRAFRSGTVLLRYAPAEATAD